jgi:hypothetical protein
VLFLSFPRSSSYIWLSVPSYLGTAALRMAYGEVSRWTGMEVKRMSTFVLAVLRNALRAPTPAERGIFNRAILCSRALLEFFFYSSYTSHDQATLDLMENTLRRFHATKDVFLRYRAGKGVAAGATEQHTDLIQQHDANLARQRLDGLSSTALQAERHSWNDFIDVEVVETVEDGAHWNFPKIHLMMHFCEQVRRFGTLEQWSTDISERSHRRQIKDGYNAGNRTGDIYLQIINHYLCLDAFTVRRLILDAWRAKHRPPDTASTAAASAATASSTAAPVAATTAATASSAAAPVAAAPPPPPPRHLCFILPQLTPGASKVCTVEGVYANMWSSDLRAALRHAMHVFLHVHHVVLSDQQLPDCPATIYHGVDVSTDDMHGSSVVQHVRCTGDRQWHCTSPRWDWVWVRQGKTPLPACAPLPYKALQSPLPYRLLRLFTLQVPCEPHPRTFWLAFVEVTRPANSGLPEEASQLVRIPQPASGVVYDVVNASRMTGAVHLVPEEPNRAGVAPQAWIPSISARGMASTGWTRMLSPWSAWCRLSCTLFPPLGCVCAFDVSSA